MIFFLQGGGSCSYDDDIVGDIDVPLRYQHLVKKWVPSDLPKVNIDFCVNERIYRLHRRHCMDWGCFAWTT